MRVMFLSTPVEAHVAPMLSLAWAARAAGHEVVFAGSPNVADVATGAGLCAEVIGDRFHTLDMLRFGLTEGHRPIHLFDKTVENSRGLSIWHIHAAYHLTRHLDFARAWRPDLIVSEQLELTGCVIGAVLGVPAIQHRWGIDALSAVVREMGGGVLGMLCRRLGLDGFPEPAEWLDPTPPKLQVPGIAAAEPLRYLPVNGAGSVPPWLHDRRADKRVCVSLGGVTVQLNGLPLFRTIIDAFDGLDDVEALVTLEPEHAAKLGPLPRNVRVVEPTPLNLFLGTCDAVVHHSGSASLMTATSFGLPQLALPQLVDQFEVADRLRATGAGLVLDEAADQDDVKTVRHALDELLAEPRFTEAAAGLAADMAAAPSPAEVVTRLEALACAPAA
ncbi:glycosyltransferase [Amycolatopsis xylanica]|uniref:Glycosyltransferase n=1 Tax=Amycolatopsis xylanica TaxID=589385 RepID=A0A1H2VNB2_9PSEU|nr:nucleotide disphospho-sugar-binding domain-containing protein [Amycolatopsis xylanica]SDW69823.1 glycosyltransferase [Amycolatopsis xylanica]